MDTGGLVSSNVIIVTWGGRLCLLPKLHALNCMSYPKSNPVGCRIGSRIGCRSDDKTRQIICFEFTQWVGHWAMKGSSGMLKFLSYQEPEYSDHQNWKSQLLACRVDSAFICLGTTRAKAGADGFVKVWMQLETFSSRMFKIQVDYDYVVESSKLLHNSGCPDLHLVSSQVGLEQTGSPKLH